MSPVRLELLPGEPIASVEVEDPAPEGLAGERHAVIHPLACGQKRVGERLARQAGRRGGAVGGSSEDAAPGPEELGGRHVPEGLHHGVGIEEPLARERLEEPSL